MKRKTPFEILKNELEILKQITIDDADGTRIGTNGVHISGNFNKITKSKPKNWIDKGYKMIVPFKFKWRHKIGKVKCDCKVCEEHYEAWYGVSWFHSKDCALMKYIDSRPQICNLNQYYGRDLSLIAQTE